ELRDPFRRGNATGAAHGLQPAVQLRVQLDACGDRLATMMACGAQGVHGERASGGDPGTAADAGMRNTRSPCGISGSTWRLLRTTRWMHAPRMATSSNNANQTSGTRYHAVVPGSVAGACLRCLCGLRIAEHPGCNQACLVFGQASAPCGHVAVPPVLQRGADAVEVPAVEPDRIGK